VGDTERTLSEQSRAAGSPDGEPARSPAPGAPAAELHAQDLSDEAALAGDVGELVAAAAQRDEYLALAQRTQADFENYRKRVARDSSIALQKGVAKVVKELLPALDSLDRALAGAAQDDPLLDGIRLVRAELQAGLARVGVERDEPLGERFDPNKHEAVAQHQREGAESGSILEVYEAGYRMGDHIIRPARVAVAA